MNDHAHFDSALVACDGERIIQPILLRRDTMRCLGEQSAFQKTSTAELIARLLDAVVRDDLFSAVLDE